MKALLSEDEFPHTARIELAPREGILAPAPKPAAKPPEAKPKTALPSGPPIELGAEPPAGGAPEALLLPPLPVPAAPLPEPLSMGDDVAAPAPAPAPAQSEAPAPLPAAAKTQVRRVAFLHSADSEAAMRGLMSFLDEVAGKVSRKPLVLERALVRVIQGLEDPAALIAAVRQAEGIAAVVMLEPLPAAWAETLAQAFEKEGIFLRVVASEDAKKRSAAVDLLVELMLLSGQAKG